MIAFDLDGTLTDSIKQNYKLCKKSMNQAGINRPKNMKEFLSFFDGNFYETVEKKGIKCKKFIKQFAKVYNTEYNAPLFPNARKIINEARKLDKIAIVSSNFQKAIKKSLHGIKIDKILGAEKGLSKVNKLKGMKVYVCDTKGDVLEGKKAGVKTIAVTWGYHSETKLKQANCIARNTKELIKCLKTTTKH